MGSTCTYIVAAEEVVNRFTIAHNLRLFDWEWRRLNNDMAVWSIIELQLTLFELIKTTQTAVQESKK